jgi:transcriptional regulator with XRE-family HTH domain
MENMIDIELLKKLRSKKCWSQEELATASGLSHRTVQRVESSGNCSLESNKALAAALDIEAAKLKLREPKWFSIIQLLKFTNYSKKAATLLLTALLFVISILVVTNYQSTAEFNIVIKDPYGVYSDVLTIELQLGETEVLELHNGYSLEIDYISGAIHELRTQLYFTGEGGKILLHSSIRSGTEFQPVKYEVNSPDNVIFTSPFIDSNTGTSST